MNTVKIKETINQYFDNELSKSEEVILFTRLSQNEEAREYFKEINLLKSAVDASQQEYPDKLDQNVLSIIQSRKNEKPFFKTSGGFYNYISYALLIVLFAISVLLYNESNRYKDKLELSHQQVYQQNQMIRVLFNSLPQAEVREKLDNQIIITSEL